MRNLVLAAAFAVIPVVAAAQSAQTEIADTVNAHILPRFASLAKTTKELSETAQDDCSPRSAALRAAYDTAFDAWIAASHLRFGPTEVGDRAFALAFWPDTRGVTPKSLNRLIADQDPIAQAPDTYAQVSIAARGFYALEYLLFDPALIQAGDTGYYCTLIQTVTADIAATSAAINTDWQSGYAAQLLTPATGGATYRSEDEVLQVLFKALTTGLEFTADTRLGRPLGTFDRPRPARAESWRSGRSAHNVALSLAALADLARHLASDDPALTADFDKAFAKVQGQLAALDDPVFARVTDPQARLKLEVAQQSVDAIRAIASQRLGPKLGVAAGFNSLDGD